MSENKKKVLVIGVIGADVHAVGNKILYHAFTQAGFDVVNLGVMVSQEEYIAAAIESNADAIVVSSLYGQGELDCRGLREKCNEAGLKDIPLDVVILGATEIDTDFNVNVHTDSNGYIMGGSGGHSDTAAGAKLSMIIAPMFRARLPIVTDRVNCISTPGEDVDVLVTQGGIAVNPRRAELKDRLVDAGLPVIDIHELKEKTERITGKPERARRGDRVVANVISRYGGTLDQIYNVTNKNQ